MTYITIPSNNKTFIPTNNVALNRYIIKVLPVPLVFQKNQNWCWSASCEMIIRYYGLNAAQCQIANIVKNFEHCCNFPEFCDHPANNLDMCTILTNNTSYEWRSLVPLTKEWVRHCIDKGQPFILCRRNPNHDVNHAIVVKGYRYNIGTDELLLLCNDPSDGVYEKRYSQMIQMWQNTICPFKKN